MSIHRPATTAIWLITVVLCVLAVASNARSAHAAFGARRQGTQQENDAVPELTNDDLATEQMAREFRLQGEAEREANAAEGLWLDALYGRAGRALAENRDHGRRRALQAAYRIIVSDPLVARAWIRVKQAVIEVETTGGRTERFNYWKRFQNDPF